MPPHYWSLKALLAPNPTQVGFTCLATTLKGARCCKRIKNSDLLKASQILDELALSSPSNPNVNNKLKDIATLCLCKRNHRNPNYSHVDRITDGFKTKIHQEVLREMENRASPYRRVLNEVLEPALQAARRRLLQAEEQFERIRILDERIQEEAQEFLQQPEPTVVEDPQIPLRPAPIALLPPPIERQPDIQVPGNELELEEDEEFEQQLAEIDEAIARVRGERPRPPRPDELRQIRATAEAMIDLPRYGVELGGARPPRPARIAIDEFPIPPQIRRVPQPQPEPEQESEPRPETGAQAIIPPVSPPQNRAVVRKPITGNCPICYEEIEDIDDADWCRGTCGQNVHKRCFERWVDIQFGPGMYELMGGGWPVRCTFCRGLWVWE